MRPSHPLSQISSTSQASLIELPEFSGPLDLLLHLIERNELDVTAISLARVSEQYLNYVERLKSNRLESLIDFLVIGAQLVLIKSRALLPQSPFRAADEEEEDPAEALARRLRAYKRFKVAAAWFHGREKAGLRSYLRLAPPPKLHHDPQLDLSGLSLSSLQQAMIEALQRVEQLEESVQVARPRQITIEGQMSRLRRAASTRGRFPFRELLSNRVTRAELSVTLLAVLELVKRLEIIVTQSEPFGPIEIETNEAADSEANSAAAPIS